MCGDIIQVMEKNQIIKNGYELNKPLYQICSEVGLSKNTVIDRAKKMGLSHPSNKKVSKIITAMGLDPKEVDHGWIKTDEASVHFRNDMTKVSVEDLVSDMVEKMKKHAPKYTPIKRVKITDPHLFVIDPADVHVGKLALAVETGEEYNIEIAKSRVIEGVEGLLQKAQGFPIEKIMFIIGNDILHFDNAKRTTTSGTPQDTDGQLHQIFKEALNLYVDIIERLVTVADVEVIYNPSNHDYMSGYMLAQAVEAWFRTCKNVTFNTSIAHRKHSTYGKNLITTTHGDGAKHNDMPSLMSTEHPDWSNKENQFRYVYVHHLHHKKTTKWTSAHDTQGVELRILRSPSAPDSWHSINGYCQAPRAIEGFIHHKEHGKVCELTHFFV